MALSYSTQRYFVHNSNTKSVEILKASFVRWGRFVVARNPKDPRKLNEKFTTLKQKDLELNERTRFSMMKLLVKKKSLLRNYDELKSLKK